MTLYDIPDWLMVVVEIICVFFPIASVFFVTKFPDAIPMFITIMKRRNFVAMLSADNVLSVRPARMEGDLWKVYDGIGKKALLTHSFESDPSDTIYLFGRPAILVRENNTRAINPKVNELIGYIKSEMGLKTKREFENALVRANYLLNLINGIVTDGGYWKKNESTGQNEFIKISFEDFWKTLDRETQEFINKFREIKDGGLVLNGLKTIRIHDVEDYIDRHNPETYAANEIYIKRKAEASANHDLKKLILIVLIISGMTLLALLYFNGGGAPTGAGSQAAAMATTFKPT